MPPPAYTRRLMAATIPIDGTATSDVVPDGVEWVVTWISATWLTGFDGYLQVYIPGPHYIGVWTSTDDTPRLKTATHQVVEPGETISASSAGTSTEIDILVTGYVLSLT